MVTLDEPPLREGESGGRVVDDETESSISSDREDDGVGDASRIVERNSAFSICLDSIFCLIRVCEKGVV